MPWLLLTLSCIVLWGTTDILYKKSSDYNDPLSHIKTFVWIGIIMAPAGGIMALCSDTLLNSIMTVKDNLYLIPLCVFYAIALFFGLLGKKHLDASVVSPLENIDGAMAYIFAAGSNPILTAPITSSYCLVTIILARIFLKERLTKKQYLSLAFLVIGIALLGISEIFNA